jgi:hypothetical protein
MRPATIIVLLLAVASVAGAQTQDDTVTLDDFVSSAEQWAQENLDKDALRVLQEADRDKVRAILAEIQKQLQGEYVLDLATVKEIAKSAIPLLENNEETCPTPFG